MNRFERTLDHGRALRINVSLTGLFVTKWVQPREMLLLVLVRGGGFVLCQRLKGGF